MGRKFTENELNNLVGTKIDELTIRKYLGKKQTKKNNIPLFECECICGQRVMKDYNYLYHHRNTNVKKSCGCKASEWTKQFNKKTKTNFNHEYYKIKEDYYEIYLKNNIDPVIVDKEGLIFLKQLNRTLQIDSRGYPFITKPNDTKQYFLMNIFKCGFEYYNNDNHLLVDHINNNVRDNRKSNLRLANAYQNTQNAKLRKDNNCGIKGFVIHRYDRPRWSINCRIQSYNTRISKEVPLNCEGLKYLIIWNIKTRMKLHNEFSNFGFDVHNKTIEEIILKQTEIFIHNLSEEDLKVFNNNGYVRKPIKNKPNANLLELKEQFKYLNLQEIIA